MARKKNESVLIRVSGPKTFLPRGATEKEISCDMEWTWLQFLNDNFKLKLELTSGVTVSTMAKENGWTANLGDQVKEFYNKYTFRRKSFVVKLLVTEGSSSSLQPQLQRQAPPPILKKEAPVLCTPEPSTSRRRNLSKSVLELGLGGSGARGRTAARTRSEMKSDSASIAAAATSKSTAKKKSGTGGPKVKLGRPTKKLPLGLTSGGQAPVTATAPGPVEDEAEPRPGPAPKPKPAGKRKSVPRAAAAAADPGQGLNDETEPKPGPAPKPKQAMKRKSMARAESELQGQQLELELNDLIFEIPVAAKKKKVAASAAPAVAEAATTGKKKNAAQGSKSNRFKSRSKAITRVEESSEDAAESADDEDERQAQDHEQVEDENKENDGLLSSAVSSPVTNEQLMEEGIEPIEIKPGVVLRIRKNYDNATLLRIQHELNSLMQSGQWPKLAARVPRTTHLLLDLFQVYPTQRN